MSRSFPWLLLIVGVLSLPTATAGDPPAGEPAVTVENVVAPGPNRVDEPKRGEFSLDAAVRFLDSAALTWHKQRQCFTCHTNLAEMYARPMVDPTAPALLEVRKQCEELVQVRWKEKGPRWEAEVVAAAAALAFHDSASNGKLSETARIALDRMWTVQREDGGVDWLKCDWPPMEIDDHYGATLMVVAAGVAPDGYAQSAAAREGLAKVKKWLAANPPPTVHHEAMLLWADSYVPDVLDDQAQQASIDKLGGLQRPDGGWAFASLGDWKRQDGQPQDVETSDGYGTGFAAYVLLRAGVSADDPRVANALNWLKANQRESGRWDTRSAYKDGHHFISHAGTAFAIMALREKAPK